MGTSRELEEERKQIGQRIYSKHGVALDIRMFNTRQLRTLEMLLSKSYAYHKLNDTDNHLQQENERLKVALHTHQSYDKTVSELHEEYNHLHQIYETCKDNLLVEMDKRICYYKALKSLPAKIMDVQRFADTEELNFPMENPTEEEQQEWFDTFMKMMGDHVCGVIEDEIEVLSGASESKSEEAMKVIYKGKEYTVEHIEDMHFGLMELGEWVLKSDCKIISVASEQSGVDRIVLRPEVQWFAEQMELMLRRHDHKGGWHDCEYNYLIDRLEEETVEMRDLEGNPDATIARVIRKSTDIANFAMMIADNTRRAGGKEQ